MSPRTELSMIPATPEHLPRFEDIRRAAFAPIFASFRSLLGDAIYEAAQAGDDAAQADLLVSLVQPQSGWEVYAVAREGTVVAFLSIRLDETTKVGEIGLNAVHPDAAGHGIGTAMYEFAADRMKEAGMRVATVSTGGDPSHAPARHAYRKAGFAVDIPSVWMCRLL